MTSTHIAIAHNTHTTFIDLSEIRVEHCSENFHLIYCLLIRLLTWWSFYLLWTVGISLWVYFLPSWCVPILRLLDFSNHPCLLVSDQAAYTFLKYLLPLPSRRFWFLHPIIIKNDENKTNVNFSIQPEVYISGVLFNFEPEIKVKIKWFHRIY